MYLQEQYAKTWATKKNIRGAENNDQQDQQQRTEEECIYSDKK